MIRVLVADDEDVIRKGIVQLVDWPAFGCEVVEECRSGKEVIEYLKNNSIDILVTDIRMPEMDGIRLLEYLQQNHEDIFSIVLTAYSDFIYAQKALRYGAVDFVVKTDFLEELPKALAKAVNQIESSKNNSSKYTANSEYNQRQYMLETLSCGGILIVEQDLEALSLGKLWYTVCKSELMYHSTHGRETEILQNIISLLESTCNGMEFYVVNTAPTYFSLIFVSETEDDILSSTIKPLLENIVRISKEILKINIKFGISRTVFGHQNLLNACNMAETALANTSAHEKNCIIYTGEDYTPEQVDFLSEFTYISDNLFSPGGSSALARLKELKLRLIEKRIDLNSIRLNMTAFCSLVINRYREHNLLPGTIDERALFSGLNSCKTIDSVFTICEELIVKTASQLNKNQNEKNYLIAHINQYIQNHYTENITLQDISEAIHISTAYISRVYKSSTGSTITDAINKLRIEKSKRLLKESTKRIYEIAYEVGYDEAAYFATVFAKYTGISPSEYRNSTNL